MLQEPVNEPDRDATLTRTKLVKLLYLVDVESVATMARAPSGLRWVFFHYGPYAFELIDELEAMEGTELPVRSWHDSVLYMGAPNAPSGDEWPPTLKMRTDRVVDRWAAEETNRLLYHVYFETEPMRGAVRGQELDLSRARGVRHRPGRPLDPPMRPADIEDRLRAWRQRMDARWAAPPDDAPREIADLPPAWAPRENIHGRLTVAEDTAELDE